MKFSLFIILFFVLSMPLNAQIMSGMKAAKVGDVKPMRLESTSSKVKIINYTEQNVRFNLSCDGYKWEQVSIPYNKLGEYSCSSQNYLYVRIITSGTTVEYKLQNRTNYVIYYDKNRRIFDIALE